MRRNRLRSLLTVGAIAIGISAMMYLISLGMGLERLTLGSVERSATLLTMTVRPIGSETLNPLTPKAIERLEKIDQVEVVMPKLTVKGEMILENQRAPATIVGVDPDYFGTSDETRLAVGRPYQKEDRRSLVVSSGFLKLFGLSDSKTPLVVFNLELSKEDFPKTGLMTALNVTGVVEDSAAIVYVPRLALEKHIGGEISRYDSAKVRVAAPTSIEPVTNEIIQQGFKVEAVIDTVQEIKRVFRWIRLILAGLGLTAIIVASIGMFNTLTVSLLERTKEIGIMKALGVKKTDIRKIFLAESFLMGLIGGSCGIVLALVFQQLTFFAFSLLATYLQGKVPQLFYNQAYVVGGFLLFSLFIALVTGIYPARRAAKINPIDAIRYE